MSDKEHTHIFNEYDKDIARKINKVHNQYVRHQLRVSWMNTRGHIKAIEGYAHSAALDIFNNFSRDVELQAEKWRMVVYDRY